MDDDSDLFQWPSFDFPQTTFSHEVSECLPQWGQDAWLPGLPQLLVPYDTTSGQPMVGYAINEGGMTVAVSGDASTCPFFGYLLKHDELWPLFVSLGSILCAVINEPSRDIISQVYVPIMSSHKTLTRLSSSLQDFRSYGMLANCTQKCFRSSASMPN